MDSGQVITILMDRQAIPTREVRQAVGNLEMAMEAEVEALVALNLEQWSSMQTVACKST